MSKYAGTKTEKNLEAAFSGESQARNRYTFWSSIAKKEGYVEVSKIFEETANQEKEHAKRLMKLMNTAAQGETLPVAGEFPVLMGTTVENLKAAAAGENEEWTHMYPEFAKKAEEEAAAKAKSEERNAVVEAVVANTEVEVPETMVNAQIDSSIMELNYSLQYQGFSIEQLLEMTGKSMQELRDERKEDAEKSVKASLVVDAIAKAENVEVSEEEVEAEVAKMAEAYNMTLPQIKEALKSNDLEDIKGQLRIRKTIDFLVENAVIA